MVRPERRRAVAPERQEHRIRAGARLEFTVRHAMAFLCVVALASSCANILGIDTDPKENPCNASDADNLKPLECYQGTCRVLIDACDTLGLPASCPKLTPQDKDL